MTKQSRFHIAYWVAAILGVDNRMASIFQVGSQATAYIFIIIGTSLNVYPAAGLVELAPEESPKFLIDPNAVNNSIYLKNVHLIADKAAKGVPNLVERLLSEF